MKRILIRHLFPLRLGLVLMLLVSFAPVAFSQTATAQASLNDGLMAYYPFNGTAKDASGNGNDGTLHGGVVPTTDRNGKSKSAYYFNGADAYISVPDDPSLNPYDQFTATFWVKTDKNDWWYPIIYKGGTQDGCAFGANREYASWVQPWWESGGGGIELNAFGAANCWFYTNTSPITTGRWYFFAGVVDLKNHVMNLYLDGALQSSVFDPNDIIWRNSYELRIGQSDEGFPLFNGTLDEIRLYNRALSPEEIQKLYGGAVPTPPPQFTFHNIDYPGANLTRARGINNHGVIVGGSRIPGVGFHAMMIQNGKFIPLAPTTILGSNWSEAFKINDGGDIVGYFQDDNGYRGFLLRKGLLTILDFPGATDTQAFGLNDSGTVAGTWDLYDAQGNLLYQGGFIWKDGNFTDVAFPGAGDTAIFGINANGDLTGGWDSGLSATTESGFVFSKGKDQFTSFDAPFPGVYATQPDDINSTGDIAGQYTDYITYLPHGFLKVGDAITSIDYPGAAYTTAWGINSAGQMVGNWYDSSGIGHGWLAEPGKKQKPSSLPKPLDLIGWWPGDGNANDIRGGSNGTLTNGTTSATGLVGQAFSFDGIDDYVDVPDTATLHAITTAVTVDAWINPQPSPTGGGWIFARRDPMVSEGIGLSIDNGGFIGTALQTDVTSFISTAEPVIQFNGQWQNIAVTADTATGKVQLYLNGKPLAVKVDGGSPTVIGKFAAVSQLFIGQRQGSDTSEGDGGAARYQGLIDEVQFYDRALSSSDIEAIYLAGIKQGR